MTLNIMDQRQAILNLFSGGKIENKPIFSGLIHITSAGLKSEGLIFHEVHKDAKKMAKATASTYKLTGFPSAVLPLDLCVEAEALGAEIDYRENEQNEFPHIKKALFQSVNELAVENVEIAKRGRVPLVCDAIRVLKKILGMKP